MSDIAQIMRSIQTGERSVEDVAAEFRTRSWPPPASVTPSDAQGIFAAELTDREPDPAGAFSEVTAAFYQGIITIDQYGVLAEAAAESTRAAAPSDTPDTDPDADPDTDPDADPDGEVTEEEAGKDVPAGQEPAETDTDPAADEDAEPDTDPDEKKPGKPKKGVNPFPKKGE